MLRSGPARARWWAARRRPIGGRRRGQSTRRAKGGGAVSLEHLLSNVLGAGLEVDVLVFIHRGRVGAVRVGRGFGRAFYVQPAAVLPGDARERVLALAREHP